MKINKSKLFTIFLMVIIASVLILPRLKTNDYEFKNENKTFEITEDKDALIVGKDIDPGFYDVQYFNDDPHKTGVFQMEHYKNGDKVIASNWGETNQISMELNDGKFILTSTNFENKITKKIEHVGNYPTNVGGLIAGGKYEFCNNGKKKMSINGKNIKSNTCKVFNITPDPQYYTYSTLDVAVVIERGSTVYSSAEDVDVSIKEV